MAGTAEIVTALVPLYITVEVGLRLTLAVVYRVGILVAVAPPTPYCIVAPAATLKMPVALPVSWNPPSEKVPESTVILLRAIVAALSDATVPVVLATTRL